ncbi:glycoside hydrolase family 16 protein [Penicillium cinerascens]|uniref:Glycoside hydrolase family 16 protein n=1 Tax=Penicillium cinerascens TaxID=70096 RepID=A0A9W9MHR4_9EURO|nr:glycoside hydrolase family 16 protein [Penicillium cinerascens]KAJ5201508.1 glycoside hydrolase family 16 protein [Penicillium cinerascens]
MCECGYSVNSTSSQHQVFTDLIESDFLTIQDIFHDTDWQIQEYATPHGTDAGPFGMNMTGANVISNPLKDNSTLSSPSKLGGDAGLQLWVRGGIPSNGLVPSAEMRTVRRDLNYGSFRAAMKLTPVNGTCSAVFSYYNDTQEIDVELLSYQYINYTTSSQAIPSSPINLISHSDQSILTEYSRPNTTCYGKPILPNSLTDEFHEYRFDWMPDRVSFYFDGQWLWDLIDDIPTSSSAMFFKHWSNGAVGWSQGPPMKDAVTTIEYFKAYFNSSDPQRNVDYKGRCKDPSAEGAVCIIPDQTVPPDPSVVPPGLSGSLAKNGSASTWFFSQHPNQTVNQTVYTGQKNAGIIRGPVVERRFWITGVVMLLISGMWVEPYMVRPIGDLCFLPL